MDLKLRFLYSTNLRPIMDVINVGILTVSDTCSQGKSEDVAGKNLAEYIVNRFGKAGWRIVQRACVPDEQPEIKRMLLAWADVEKLHLVLTTGGTGFSPRDVTPEATRDVIEKFAPGLVQVMQTKSLDVTPMAMLSRPVAGIRGQTLIINLPGSSKGARECFQFISDTLPHALDVLNEAGARVTSEHVKLHGGHTCGGHNQPPHQEQHQHHHHHGGHEHHSHSHGSNVDDTKVAMRPRESPFPMISVHEAQKKVLEFCDVIGTEMVSFRQALGRVLAEDVFARDPLPPFPASIKDGYAVVSSDGAGIRPVIGGAAAGSKPNSQLQPGQCVRINTGAPVPAGADAVVQVEDTKLVKSSEDGKTELEIEILTQPIPGQDIRPVGSDIALGSKVLPIRSRLGSAEVGLLAAVGATQVKVYKLPTVALLSTGDEIQDPTEDPSLADGSGLIRDSNKTTLISLINGEYAFPVIDCGIARDDVNLLMDKLKMAFTAGDITVTTGGVSMGDRDLLRQVLVQDFGATIHFARVNMKPGKPTTFATLDWEGKQKIILGLPGNPVSATVTAHLYVLPACRKIAGYGRPLAAYVRAKLSHPVRLDPRPEYQRVVLSWSRGESVATITNTGNQISSRLESFRAANGLIVLPGGSATKKIVEAGEEVDAMIIGPLLADE